MDAVDLLVVGGGINGAGIARDAAGRGLSVLLVEKDDLASGTSSWSSKLVHGGIRYLEYYEFRLVAQALAEREVLLRVAGHLVWPARFVMPHVPELRPRWMIRAGLFLYDHLARRNTLPASRSVRLDAPGFAGVLQAKYRHGFTYSDCRTDDARLVIANVRDAADRGARVETHTELISARRHEDQWQARLRVEGTGEREVRARAIVNAAGPWVTPVREERLAQPVIERIRLVRGSHIVVPRLYEGDDIFLLQNDDRRVVFTIPFEQRFTLIGTTDQAMEGAPQDARVSAEEIEYLCRAVNRYLARAIAPSDVRWHYTGVRPLVDDGETDPSAVTRDYILRVEDAGGAAPVLSVFGGKITTFRKLAEKAVDDLRAYFPSMGSAWTAGAALRGSAFARDRANDRQDLAARYPDLPAALLDALFLRHGALAAEVLGDARTPADLGEDFGASLSERELRYFVENEWARSADDVLWRRSKVGLHLDEAARARVAGYLGR